FAVAVARGAKGASVGNGRARATQVLAGECSGPEEVVAACAERAVVAHDAKALGLVAPGLSHDTLLGAYLLDPARRGYPFAELCEERGLVSDLDDPLAADAVLLRALADWQRAQIAELELDEVLR